jgi:hypothetical protein
MYFTIISYYFFENKFVIANCTRNYNINSTKTHPAYLVFIRVTSGILIIDKTGLDYMSNTESHNTEQTN